MAGIHPSAVVAPGAEIGARVTIGPFCVVGPKVRLGDDVELVSHVSVDGLTTVGAGTRIFPFAAIGHRPQDLKHQGEDTRLEIGAANVIREQVTMHPGTSGGGGLTRIGDNCLFMIGAHVAHDCRVGDNVVMVNHATLGGHVKVGDFAMLGGLCAIHQYVRIGPYAMIGGMSGVEADVIPFGLVMGERARLSGLNIVGLKRRNFSRLDIQALRTAYRLLFAQEGTMAERLDDVASLYPENRAVGSIIDFIRSADIRAVTLPKIEK
ncbi:MAG: acyl-ACP--UDP-N-acetylglucosamine O-acyltransferase [Rhodospirillales bacterium]|jgi:UDP-N-acetylglucosamine acyltransferase